MNSDVANSHVRPACTALVTHTTVEDRREYQATSEALWLHACLFGFFILRQEESFALSKQNLLVLSFNACQGWVLNIPWLISSWLYSNTTFIRFADPLRTHTHSHTHDATRLCLTRLNQPIYSTVKRVTNLTQIIRAPGAWPSPHSPSLRLSLPLPPSPSRPCCHWRWKRALIRYELCKTILRENSSVMLHSFTHALLKHLLKHE